MAGERRSPDEVSALKDAARARREDGQTMHEIARALEVPASTLYRWAAEGGWRLADLTAERFKSALSPDCHPGLDPGPGESLTSSVVPDEALRVPGLTSLARDDNVMEEKENDLTTHDAAEMALSASMRLMRSGRVSEAGAAARLAERYLHLTRLQAELDALRPEPEPYNPDDDITEEELRAELEQKIAHIIESTHGVPAYEPGEEPEGFVSRLPNRRSTQL